VVSDSRNRADEEETEVGPHLALERPGYTTGFFSMGVASAWGPSLAVGVGLLF